MTDAAHDLDARAAHAAPDRWLSSRFVTDPVEREGLLTLYAFDHELARISVVVSQPMLGEIRFAWWREALDELTTGQPPRSHPVVEALARLNLGDAVLLHTMIDARERDLDAARFEDEAEALAYIDGTSGALMAAAARLLDPTSDVACVQGAARAWGWAAVAGEGRLGADLLERLPALVDAALVEARRELPALPAKAFPAVAHATFARSYAKGRRPSDLSKRLRLIWAVVRGRI
jgi:phytoene synthase